MVWFNNTVYMFSIFMYLSMTVLESYPRITNRNQICPSIKLNNGRVKVRGRVARITCDRSFKLVQGSGVMTCTRGQWNNESPICAKTGCTSVLDNISHGKLIVIDNAKIEIHCDVGYIIDGLNFTYCNEYNEWNDELKGCRENDRIYLSCDFESSEGRFCGWQNDRFNIIDWLADKASFAFFFSRHHVSPGSSQYFSSNYISLDAEGYGSSISGKLISPEIPPVKNKQRCLIFSYKVTSRSSIGAHSLTVTFGDVPHWTTTEGEGRVIIGLYKFNITSHIKIEGKNCKSAIDNIIITEGRSCSQKPYEDELYSCHDNCGKISYDNDNSCSCDWECYINDNCCSDISSQCPYIKPIEEINRLYLTTTTPFVPTTTKNPLNLTITDSMFPLKRTIGSNEHVTVSTSRYEHVTMITLTQNLTTSQIPYSRTVITDTSTGIPKLNNDLIFNSTSYLHHSNLSTTAMAYSDVITPNATTKLINTSNVTPNISSTTPVVIISVNGFSSTIKQNTANISKELNTSSITTKSLMDSQFSNTNLINLLNKTINSTTVNTHFSTKTINSFYNDSITTKSVIVSTANPEEKKTFDSTIIQPLMTTTLSIIDVPNITTKYSTDSSTNPTKLINSSSTVKTFSSTFNEPNSFEQVNTNFTTQSLIKKKIAQNDVITESEVTISNSTTLVPYINSNSVPYEDKIVVDIDQPNPNFSHFIYKTSTQYYNYYNSTLKNNKSSFNNNYTSNGINAFTMFDSDNTSTEQMNKSNYPQAFSVSYYVIIIKYLAALGVIFITVKYSLSFLQWYFKKPIDDDMDSCFIKTDNESSCNMELKSH